MSNRPLTDEAGEVRELTTADLKRMKPANEVLPAELASILPKRNPGQRGPAKRPTKESITLRLDPDIVEHFRGTGRGWQGRINEALKVAIGRSS
ncbi:BrnA antitoxin family protein [Aureimonas frigidaquae]|uniref:BrnA antitoxin family protein n=1 Tax=Aureimonas frigidaquae TaxID=424757 RepID=UPI0007830E5B|nr:BrnA antitoxin family protein [Aureimonas frigidaquae]